MHNRLVSVDEETVSCTYEMETASMGHGSYANVVAAMHVQTGIPVAMKIINKAALASAQERASVKR
jgi:serine/threonine protein kinase